MTLFKLSLKNIGKSIKDYAIYFFTLILGVAIFYVFNAIDDQTLMMNISASTKEIIKLMTNMLSGVSVFVSFILAFLIIYASRFLIKRRNKEFGIYLTLGMSKRKISLILFFETLIIGFISLIVGLMVGFLLSQLMSILVANMFEADLTRFEFVFSESAATKCLIYFGIMYLVVMIFNTINISKCKLIDLLHADKKSETVKIKNPWVCILIFVISSITLGYLYYLVCADTEGFLDNLSLILYVFALGVLATFFIFWSLSGLVLKLALKSKNFYYKGLNSFTFRQISSKVNTMVFSVTIICLMLFITICILSSSLSIKNSLNKNLKYYAPRDVELTQSMLSGEDDMTTPNKNIKEVFNSLGVDLDKSLKNVVSYSLYYDDDVTLKTSLGSYYKEAKEKYSYLWFDDHIILMKNSDYNNIADSFNLKKFDLNDDEYAVVGNYKSMLAIKNEALKRNALITLDGNNYYPKYKKAINGFYQMGSQKSEIGFIVLPDEALKNAKVLKEAIVGDFTDAATDKKINKIASNEKIYSDYGIAFNTKKDIGDAAVGLGAILTFLGLYLGIIFLISCAAILALKELSESSDNADKFRVLRQIGTDEKMLNRTLFRQIGIFFMFPLVLAVIHSIFGIVFCNNIIKTLGVSFNLKAVIVTSLIIIFIYGGYFLITYYSSRNIIKER